MSELEQLAEETTDSICLSHAIPYEYGMKKIYPDILAALQSVHAKAVEQTWENARKYADELGTQASNNTMLEPNFAAGKEAAARHMAGIFRAQQASHKEQAK